MMMVMTDDNNNNTSPVFVVDFAGRVVFVSKIAVTGRRMVLHVSGAPGGERVSGGGGALGVNGGSVNEM